MPERPCSWRRRGWGMSPQATLRVYARLAGASVAAAADALG